MKTLKRTLLGRKDQGDPLPVVEQFADLYRLGMRANRGDLIMVAGRSGSMKSTFAIQWVTAMRVPTLYFSGDMSEGQLSQKMSACQLHIDQKDVEDYVHMGLAESDDLGFDGLQLCCGELTWKGIEEELEAYIELWNAYPEVIVIDNLMDIQGAWSEYHVQMEAMQFLRGLASNTGAAVIVLHHATDKGDNSMGADGIPPARREIKNGLSEKPSLILSVGWAAAKKQLNVAIVKNRMGPADASGFDNVPLQGIAEQARFESLGMRTGDIPIVSPVRPAMIRPTKVAVTTAEVRQTPDAWEEVARQDLM